MPDYIPERKQLVLFDGVCNLCNSSIKFIIKHDNKHVFLFAPLQSKVGKTILSQFNLSSEVTDYIVLYNPKKGISTKSTAVLKIAHSLKFPINLWVLFLIIPKFIRDNIYLYIAKNRYAWFGKNTSCSVPSATDKNKFLD